MLSDTKKWNSHGRGISKEVLIRDVRLKIEDFGEDADMSKRVRKYHKLVRDYMGRLGTDMVVHYRGRFVRLSGS